MKIIYIFSNRKKALSIEKKAVQFSKLLNTHGVETEIYNVSRLNLFKIFFLIGSINKSDIVYVRDNFNPYCMIVALLFSKKCVLECNRPLSYRYGRKNLLFQYARNIMNKVMYFRLRKFNCVTNEICESVAKSVAIDAKVISLGNIHGYLARQYSMPIRLDKKEFDFAFLGDLTQSWQGKERIFSCLRRNRDYKLLIIGNEVEIPQDIFEQVTQVGMKTDNGEILYLLGKAKTGLSAMDMSQRRQKYISALKHADYVAAGLPIIASAEDSFLIDKYIYKVLPNDIDLTPLECDDEFIKLKQLEVKNSAEQIFKDFILWLKQ